MLKALAGGGRRGNYNLTGLAGEYFVAAELSRRGWIATVTLKNTPKIDVMATRDGTRTVLIQVKTRSAENRKGWSDYYLIPQNLFARWLSQKNKDWLARPGLGGRKHRDNPIRVLTKSQLDEFKEYHNNWEL